jgi:hypothetical protein
MGTVLAVPAPVGGWNVRDSVADLPEQDAQVLDNWFPRRGRVDTRPGYSSYATGLEGNVETLAELNTGAAKKLLAAANGKLWDISVAGAGTSKATGFSNNRWYYAQMNGTLGLVNGEDAPQVYNGTTVSAMTVSGPTIANLIGVNVFQGRSYFWEDSSASFWYSSVNTFGGALTEFNLSRIGNRGGKITTMETWTHDGGSGSDDFAVFVKDSGDVIVYQGSDPSQFALVGVFELSAPIGRRCALKMGGDLLLVTQDGYISMAGALTQGRITERGILSTKIGPAVSEDAKNYGTSFGWQPIYYPKENMLIINIPRVTNTKYQQHVLNTITGAWCRFTDIQSRCWGLYNESIYFGGSATVYLFDNTREDAGAVISCDAFTAPTWLRSNAQQKHVTAVQVVTSSPATVPLSVALGADFELVQVSYNTNTYPLSASSWDTAIWDVDEWADDESYTSTTEWLNKNAYGYNFAARVRVRGNAMLTKWYSINYMYEPAGLV